jgi:hypothetical protein
MQGYSRFPFRRVIVTRDTTYGTAYTAISDTLIRTSSIREVYFKNGRKGMIIGFFIGISPGVIICASAAGLNDKKDVKEKRSEGAWLGAFGALIGVGFSHDAAPTDTIVFRSKKTK